MVTCNEIPRKIEELEECDNDWEAKIGDGEI